LEKAERIRELYSLYTEAKATKAELAEFFALADEPGNEEIFRELFSGTWEELQMADPHNKQIRPVRRITVFSRRVAAAAALLILVSGTYFLLNRKSATETTPLAQTKKPADIAPGGNKAILTLANGSKIILDSAANGTLAQQGNTKIIKTDNGKLAYDASKEKPTEITYNTLSTPRGGQYQLNLPDGSKVWLNAASSITYPTSFVGKERKVTITGEAYFEVTHDAAKTFKVQVKGTEVEDLGTHFNINAYPEEQSINTTLLEGKVRVTSGSGTNSRQSILKPSQQARVVGEKIQIANDPDLDQVMAWKNGEMALTYGNTQKLMQDISRWYDVDIEYAGKVPEGKFSGSISRNVPLSSILNALKAYGIQTRLEEKKLIIQ
jgi:transmembrane sensor